jgi:hypothetical protein
MPEFKSISRDAVPLALEKAERYRLLNEPAQAESVCRDVLAVDPENQHALVTLLLTLTDQFSAGSTECFDEAMDVVPKLHEEYQRLYYSGIIWERRGQARAIKGGAGPGSSQVAHAWICQAMEFYERAERLRPPANDDALLRWNSCLRLCQRYHLHAEPEEAYEPLLGD